MVQVTRGKNVIIETYDCVYKEFTATAAQVDFSMNTGDTAIETDSKYSRVYVDSSMTPTASVTITNTTLATYTIPACTAGQLVQITMPKTKNGAYAIPQGVQMAITTRNQEIPELGNDSVTEEVLERVMRINLAWAQAWNHDLMVKLLANADADKYMVIVEKYKNTTPVSYRIFLECKVDDFGQSVSAGGISMETCSFTTKYPMEIKIT